MKEQSDIFKPIFDLIDLCNEFIPEFNEFDSALRSNIKRYLEGHLNFDTEIQYQKALEDIEHYNKKFEAEAILSEFLRTSVRHNLDSDSLTKILGCISTLKKANNDFRLHQAELAYVRAYYQFKLFSKSRQKYKNIYYLKDAATGIKHALDLYKNLENKEKLTILVPYNDIALLCSQILAAIPQKWIAKDDDLSKVEMKDHLKKSESTVVDDQDLAIKPKKKKSKRKNRIHHSTQNKLETSVPLSSDLLLPEIKVESNQPFEPDKKPEIEKKEFDLKSIASIFNYKTRPFLDKAKVKKQLREQSLSELAAIYTFQRITRSNSFESALDPRNRIVDQCNLDVSTTDTNAIIVENFVKLKLS